MKKRLYLNEHLNDRQLLAYVEDALSPERREQAEAHLRACAACRARVESTARMAENLTATLQSVGEQIPLTPERSWEAVARRREQRPGRSIPLFRPPLRQLATLAVLAVFVVGLAGLVHTLATTGLPTEDAPRPTPTSVPRPSSVPGPLPRSPGEQMATPISVLVLGIDETDGESSSPGEIDVLMLVHLDAKAEHAFLFSIPRDLQVELPGGGQSRAGSIYEIGERDEATDGLALARETLSATLGLPIQHAILVRFESFVTLIDAIGGVEIEVPHPIEDPDFPDNNYGYDPLSIPAGPQRFDGTLALRYVRTQVVPAPGFDRAFRQQQLILAAHERVTRLDLLPELIAQAPELWSTIADGIETDLSLSEVIDLALLASSLSPDAITAADLDECCTATHATHPGKQVLLPQPEEIEELIDDLSTSSPSQ